MFVRSAPPRKLLDFIKTNRKFLIVGHKEPDADCIGSALALSSALRRAGKETMLLSAGPFKRYEVLPYKKMFSSTINEEDKKNAVILIVDCSAGDRVGDEFKESLAGLPFAVIDHHATNEAGLTETAFVDRSAPSTTVLIYAIIKALGLPVTEEEAGLLFLGLCTDTGFFRHLDSSGAEVFAVAGELTGLGANPKKTFAAINGGKTLNSRLLLGAILSRAKAYFNGRLIVSSEKLEERKAFGEESRDSDTMYQLFQSIAGVEAVAVLRQESPENCLIGLRSAGALDVGEIAFEMGGGGHKNAAGASVKGTIEELEMPLIERFRRVFDRNQNRKDACALC